MRALATARAEVCLSCSPACAPPPPPATSTSLPQQCASAGQACEHGNNLRRRATLARLATVGVSMARGGHLPRWTTDVDRKRDERFFNCCCMSVCTLADHRAFIGKTVSMLGAQRPCRHVTADTFTSSRQTSERRVVRRCVWASS